MSLTTLKDDLLQEFREERSIIDEQIELLQPLADSLRKPAAQRLLSSGTLIIAEISCYITAVSGLAFVAFMHKIDPFTVLRQMLYDSHVRGTIGAPNVTYLVAAVYGLALVCVAMVFVAGRMAREMRLKNDIINHAGRDIKTILGQHLTRKAVMESIEQRHLLGPVMGVSIPRQQAGMPKPQPAPQPAEISQAKPGAMPKPRPQQAPDERFSISNLRPRVNEMSNPGFG